MGPDWWVEAAFAAEEAHDPDDYDGRSWDELTAQEHEDAINEVIYSVADAGEAA